MRGLVAVASRRSNELAGRRFGCPTCLPERLAFPPSFADRQDERHHDDDVRSRGPRAGVPGDSQPSRHDFLRDSEPGLAAFARRVASQPTCHVRGAPPTHRGSVRLAIPGGALLCAEAVRDPYAGHWPGMVRRLFVPLVLVTNEYFGSGVWKLQECLFFSAHVYHLSRLIHRDILRC